MLELRGRELVNLPQLLAGEVEHGDGIPVPRRAESILQEVAIDAPRVALPRRADFWLRDADAIEHLEFSEVVDCVTAAMMFVRDVCDLFVVSMMSGESLCGQGVGSCSVCCVHDVANAAARRREHKEKAAEM